jgi:hypothetical protein
LRNQVKNEDFKIRETNAHESQTDAKKGFGGKFGVQSDRIDKSAVGFEYHEKLASHASQKGLHLILLKFLSNIFQSIKSDIRQIQFR